MFQLCACHSDIPQYNSSETFRNVPLLLSHVCPAALSFDGYGKRLFLGTKSNHNRESNAPKIKMISGAVFRSDDGGIWL
jgi:hypothetical protein